MSSNPLVAPSRAPLLTANATQEEPMRDKVEFPTNTPVFIKLDFNEGVLKPGKYGDEFMYVVDNDERIFFAKPELHNLIAQSGARAGDEIAICKREVKNDTGRKTVRWEVERVQEEPPEAYTPPATPMAQPPARTNGNARPAAAPATAPAPPQPQPAPELAAQLCEVHREANCQVCAQASRSNPLTPALALAIDAAAVAELQAHRRGLAIRFSAEDVRAMALTVYIDQRRNGGSR